METSKIATAGLASGTTNFISSVQENERDVVIQKGAYINASIDKVWKVLGPEFEHASRWAASVNHSEARDNYSFNGSACTERGCSVEGIGNVKERILEYSDDNHLIKYQVYEGMPQMVKYAANTWQLIQIDENHTKVISTIEMNIGGILGKLMKGMMKVKMRKLQQEVVEEFKHYVETGKPHPRKVKAAEKFSKK